MATVIIGQLSDSLPQEEHPMNLRMVIKVETEIPTNMDIQLLTMEFCRNEIAHLRHQQFYQTEAQLCLASHATVQHRQHIPSRFLHNTVRCQGAGKGR